MVARRVESSANFGASARHLAPVLLLFMGSGCAALIYEIVWFQLLSLVIGSSAISLAVLLGTFMGGMCLGSIGFDRFASAKTHPLRVYALLELGIAALAMFLFAVLPYAGGLYIAIGGRGVVGLTFRALLCALCLLPPTALMGATFPAIARWLEATSRGASWLGSFYAANTIGAVLGCIVSGYYLLRVYDTTIATLVAMVVNAAVALGASSLSRLVESKTPPIERRPEATTALRGSSAVYIAIALSGMTALATEVVWTRLLALLLGGTVYAFSLILAVFLLGIGVGSGAASAITRRIRNARAALGICQYLLVGGVLWGAYWLTQALPYWPLNPTLPTAPIYQFQLDLVRCVLAVFPAACLWGASFPFALASIVPEKKELNMAGVVGLLYAANTVGSIVGAVAASLLLIPWLGTHTSQQAVMIVSAVSACFVLVPRSPVGSGLIEWDGRRIVLGVLGVAFAGSVALGVPAVPAPLIAWGQNVAGWWQHYNDIVYVGEGMNSSVAVSTFGHGLNYHEAGKVQASTLPKDMRLQRMLGHLATLVPERPSNTLVIGCGAGITAGAVSLDPAVDRETIVELESLVPRRVTKYFDKSNFDVLDNPKVRVEIDDARHFVMATDEKFDAVTSDPFDPWVKGAAALYTKEFLDLVKERLNPGGVVTIFVQLYESTEDAVKSEIVTFLEVFPEGVIFGNTENGKGYDVVLLGRAGAGPINLERIDQRLGRPEYEPVRRSLGEVGFRSTVDLFSSFAVAAPELKAWLEGAEINRDRNLRLQYLAGLGLNIHDHVAIYAHMTQARRYPNDLFAGNGDQLVALKRAMRFP